MSLRAITMLVMCAALCELTSAQSQQPSQQQQQQPSQQQQQQQQQSAPQRAVSGAPVSANPQEAEIRTYNLSDLISLTNDYPLESNIASLSAIRSGRGGTGNPPVPGNTLLASKRPTQS